MHKETYTKVFIAALLTTGKTWKQPKCPSVGEYFKSTVEYYAAVQKNKVELYVLIWTDLQNMLMGGEKKKQVWYHFYILKNKKEKN